MGTAPVPVTPGYVVQRDFIREQVNHVMPLYLSLAIFVPREIMLMDVDPLVVHNPLQKFFSAYDWKETGEGRYLVIYIEICTHILSTSVGG
jgi:hypothetical protein